MSKTFDTKSGVRQGCPASPFLFNFAIDIIMETVLSGLDNSGIEIAAWDKLVDLEYADDIVLVLDDFAKAQKVLNRVAEAAQIFGLIACRSRARSLEEKCQLTLEIAGHYTEQGDHSSALTQYQLHLDLRLTNPDDGIKLAIAHRLLADCHLELANYDEAVKETNAYLELANQASNVVEQQRAHVTLGRCYLARAPTLVDAKLVAENLSSSLLAFNNSLKLVDKLNLPPSQLTEMRAVSLFNSGHALRAQASYQSAFDTFLKVIRLGSSAGEVQLPPKLVLQACYQLQDLTLNSDWLLPKVNSNDEQIDQSSSAWRNSHLTRSMDTARRILRPLSLKSSLDSETKEVLRSVREYLGHTYLAAGQCRKAGKVYHLIKIGRPTLSREYQRLLASAMRASDLFSQLTNDEHQLLSAADSSYQLHEQLGDLFSRLELNGPALRHYHYMLEISQSVFNANANKDDRLTRTVDSALVSLAESYRSMSDYAECTAYYRREIDWQLSHGNASDAELASSWLSLAQALRRSLPRANRSSSKMSETVVDCLQSALVACRSSTKDDGSTGPLLIDILSELVDYLECNPDQDVNGDVVLARKELTQTRRLIEGSSQAGEEAESNSQSADEGQLTPVDTNDEEQLTRFVDALSSDSDLEQCTGSAKLMDEFSNRASKGRKGKKALCLKTNIKGETALHVACINGDLDHVVRLIEVLNHPVNVPDGAGWLPLHEAAYHGRLEIATFLLDNGARLDDFGCPADNSTPLFEAVHSGSLQVALLLVERGADLWHRNKHGECLNHLLDQWEPIRRSGAGSYDQQRQTFARLLEAVKQRLGGSDQYDRWCKRSRRRIRDNSPGRSSSPLPNRQSSRSFRPGSSNSSNKTHKKNKPSRHPPSPPSPVRPLRGRNWYQLCDDLQPPAVDDVNDTVEDDLEGQKENASSRRSNAVASYKAAMQAMASSGSSSANREATAGDKSTNRKRQTTSNRQTSSSTIATATKNPLPGTIDLDDHGWLVSDDVLDDGDENEERGESVPATKRRRRTNSRQRLVEAQFGTVRRPSACSPSAGEIFVPLDSNAGLTSTQKCSTSPAQRSGSPTFDDELDQPNVVLPDVCPTQTRPMPIQPDPTNHSPPTSVKVAFSDYSVLIPIDDQSRSVAWLADEALRRWRLLQDQSSDSSCNSQLRLTSRDGAYLLPIDRLHSVLPTLASSNLSGGGRLVELLAEFACLPPTSSSRTSASADRQRQPASHHSSVTTTTRSTPSTVSSNRLSTNTTNQATHMPNRRTAMAIERLCRGCNQLIESSSRPSGDLDPQGRVKLDNLGLTTSDLCLVLGEFNNKLRHSDHKPTELYLQNNQIELTTSNNSAVDQLTRVLLPHLARHLTLVNFSGNCIQLDGLVSLFGCLADSSCRPASNTCAGVVNAYSFPNLKRLNLSFNPLLLPHSSTRSSNSPPTDCHLPAVSANNRLLTSVLSLVNQAAPQLRHLNLAGCSLHAISSSSTTTVSSSACLASLPNCILTSSNLSTLDLGWNSGDLDLIDQLISWLSACHQPLRSLRLRGSGTANTNQSTFLPSGLYRHLRDLDINSSSPLPSLGVRLEGSRGDRMVKCLAEATDRGNLRLQKLDLGHCQLTQHSLPGLRSLLSPALATSSTNSLTGLHKLRLDHNPSLTDPSVWAGLIEASTLARSCLSRLAIDLPQGVDNSDTLNALVAGVEVKQKSHRHPLTQLILTQLPDDWHKIDGTRDEADASHLFCSQLARFFPLQSRSRLQPTWHKRLGLTVQLGGQSS